MINSIVWFKSDLRLNDNETLVRAIEQSDKIIPVYCLDDAHLNTCAFGFEKIGSYRAKFLLQSVYDLDKSLRKLGSGLLVVKGRPEKMLLELAKVYNVRKVFAKKEVAYEEIRTDELVEKELWKINCSMDRFSTSTMYHAEDLPFTIKDIPDMFTNFRKRVEKESQIRPAYGAPVKINSPELPPSTIYTLSDLSLSEPIVDKRRSILFQGGESEALKRLKLYFFGRNAVATYKESRNGLLGEDYSTKFSPWLANGCISPRFIYQELKKYEQKFGANESTYWLEFELLWRDYFRFIMKKHRNKLFQENGLKISSVAKYETKPEDLNKWINGNTGSDFVDANMLELKLTGFMSNRGRQNVASYLVNDLKVDWRYGAAYFEQQLIDYDVCSNWGNWAYLAGVGTDPRGQRIFNIEKQAEQYDPEGLYRKTWLKSA